jgi:hypothetical protein
METKFEIADRLVRELGKRYREMTRDQQERLVEVYKLQEPNLEGDEKLGCQRLIRLYERILKEGTEPAPTFREPESLKWNTLGLRERENIVKIVEMLYRDGLVTEEVLEHYNRLLAESRERVLQVPEHPGRPS